MFVTQNIVSWNLSLLCIPNVLTWLKSVRNIWATFFKLFGDENVTRYYNLLPFQMEQDGQKLIDWFSNRFREGQGIRWGIALKGSPHIIGSLGFNNYTKNHRANLGYDLQTVYWNNGYITEALQAVIPYGFNELEVNRIEAEVMQGNTASEKVLEKLGFQNEGILREWMLWNGRHYDMTMFSLLKKDTNGMWHTP